MLQEIADPGTGPFGRHYLPSVIENEINLEPHKFRAQVPEGVCGFDGLSCHRDKDRCLGMLRLTDL